MKCKVILLTGISLLYFKLVLHNSDEIEPNTYFIRLCKNENDTFLWTNINDTFLVNKPSSPNYLMNLSDPNVKYKAIYKNPYIINSDVKIPVYTVPSEEVTLEVVICEIHLQVLVY